MPWLQVVSFVLDVQERAFPTGLRTSFVQGVGGGGMVRRGGPQRSPIQLTMGAFEGNQGASGEKGCGDGW